ncbi:MAG: DNA/RNA nuclease SfsA [Kordiimonas sp.]|nr:DNA/RNA nuclease SfsA [Kordiimonas sp.]|tara:strand:- start:4329 stop:5045 length:717 start_codon:yes stop_codon:yes gene_type:complete
MKFENTLIPATLLKRYKRFLADVTLENGDVVTAHCANSGSMMGLKDEDNKVWLSPATNPKAKLPYKWEMVRIPSGALVGINTSHPNRIVAEAIANKEIPGLDQYDSLRREVKYGTNSRIDILLENNSDSSQDSKCYVEVKNVTLSREPGYAEFPDAVTARGTKHLQELTHMVHEGHRAVMFYLVQRDDCSQFRIANDIDPAYDSALKVAVEEGVEIICYACRLSPTEIELDRPLPIML